MPGSCVGLVTAHLGIGRILRLAAGGRTPPASMLKGLDEPNGLALGPNGTLYVGLLGRVIRFNPGASDPAASLRDVVVNLPETGRHPLNALAVAPDGSLFLNVGSATDHCEQADDAPRSQGVMPETTGTSPRGVILHVTPGGIPTDARTIAPYACCLRNSMAVTVLPCSDVVAGVSARDYIDQADNSLSDEALPHDTFDRVEQGADYGWSYCYDRTYPVPNIRISIARPSTRPPCRCRRMLRRWA
jgi:glucose/arabinose dehydrogenase